eukprot:TRINITY_DN547_c0_g1_i4.p4 TRINITY_DN547_c0_g1~~TRINITY_DN547_c0_g1_i4.p4  ORF type:complete len:103 (-),score=24.25 TRINITY_DN547_c0_g1_i4:886-1194(-)
MVSHLKDDQIQYCLIRLPEVNSVKDAVNVDRKDGKILTKDIFINWSGPAVRQIEKGQKKSHVGDVSAYLKPFHADLSAVNRENFTEEVVRERYTQTQVTFKT